MRELSFFSDYLTAEYGMKVHRIAFDLALGCPNRPGRFGEGCSFCAEKGNAARHLAHIRRRPDLKEQYRLGAEYVRNRYGTETYVPAAYFQAFTSTYAPVGELRKLYGEALACANFKVVIIGTRPDALEEEVVAYLAELNHDYEVWVELGVQSAHDATLAAVGRGHDFAAAATAARRLEEAGINMAAHLILGLPGEDSVMFKETARQIAALPFRAVKIHPLLLLKGTRLARQVAEKSLVSPFAPLNEYEYARELADFLLELPDDMLLMRLTAEAPEEELIAPRWQMKKGQFLDFFKNYFAGRAAGEIAAGDFLAVTTEDGSKSFYHPLFKQHFHSLAGAESEAEKKFIEPSNLAGRLQDEEMVRILDIGFGLGVNAFCAVKCAERESGGVAEITALEIDERTVEAARSISFGDATRRRFLSDILDYGEYVSPHAETRIIWGDARQSILRLAMEGKKFDLIFLDAFSVDCNVELWSYDFVRRLRDVLAPGGVVVTYSGNYAFLGALLRAGYRIGSSAPFGRRKGGTVAVIDGESPGAALPAKEMGIISRSTAGVPYRDVGLGCSREEILCRRDKLVMRLRGRGVPKWYKGS